MKDEKRKKDRKRKGLGRLPVPVSRADVEAAFMARYASIGLGFGTSPEDMRRRAPSAASGPGNAPTFWTFWRGEQAGVGGSRPSGRAFRSAGVPERERPAPFRGHAPAISRAGFPRERPSPFG